MASAPCSSTPMTGAPRRDRAANADGNAPSSAMAAYTRGPAMIMALTVAAVFVLRVRAPALARPYRTLGYPVTPALFLVIAGLIVVAGFHLHRWNAVIALGLAVVIPVGHWLVIGRPGRAPDPAA